MYYKSMVFVNKRKDKIMYTEKNHTFVICAYKENPYIEETIQSLMNQTKKSKILLSTSTPSEYLDNICKKYDIPCHINPNPHLAGDDWNYAYSVATTELVTLAHQDDIYEPTFLEETLQYINKRKKDDVLIAFTDYYENKLGAKEESNLLLKIKRVMNAPLSLPLFYGSKFMRRRLLSVGCAICCPAVTYVKKNLGEKVFDTTYINSCDYKTWVDLADRKGAFVYVPKKLLGHRIYAESATTLNLSENIRQKEDFEILCHYWPAFIAKRINKVYAKSEDSNIV